VAGHGPAALPKHFNSFFSRFETYTSYLKEKVSSMIPAGTELSFNTEEMVRALKRTKMSTVPGPDNISGRVLRCCTELLGGMFQHSTAAQFPQMWSPS